VLGLGLRLRSNEIRQELAKVQSWRLSGKKIQRAFDFEDFNEAMRFVNRVARLAESMNHHPDILIQYNKVKLSLTTHDEGGLTMKDFRLAQKINRIVK
jgi:4a-hydroxytetrahydrobiopterin dehydratase